MALFKKILAATDLSPESFSAVSFSSQLALEQGAELTVLHVPHSTSLVYTDFAPPIDMLNIDAAIEKASREQLEEWVSANLDSADDVGVIVRNGITHETICEVATEVGADLVVMATHGRKGLGHLVLGSVTERVLRDAPCPMLVIKPSKPLVEGESQPAD